MMWRSAFQIARNTVAIITVALLFVSASRAQQPTTGDSKAADRSIGTITGRVVDPAGEPLLGATAYVVPVGLVAGSQNAAVDSSGNFKVDGLETGLYRVWASIPGYVALPQATTSESGYYHAGDSVTLTMIKGAVITGTVTGANGPAVATTVRAIRVRDDEGKPLSSLVVYRERLTDDRGVYRIYGLPPGAYLISAGGPARFGGSIAPSAYDTDTPTYFPSATRDTASQIVVRNAEEVTADIQYRGEPGHSISGTIGGLAQSQSQISTGGTISLTDVRDRSTIMNAAASSYSNYAFAFYGVPDGEYELAASQFLPSRDSLRSDPRRVKVLGADVTGINLAVAPLASIGGRLVLESDPKSNCGKRRATAAQETIILARRYVAEAKPPATPSKTSQTADVQPLLANYVAESVPDGKGNFTLRNLEKGSYRLDPRAPASGWYIRSIAIGSTQAGQVGARNTNSSVARDGITLKSGERVSGLTVTIAEGAASFRGRLTVADGQSLPPNLRVYLVPAEKDNVDNVLRFFETRAENDGSFAIGNIAPGHYWMIERAADESDPATVRLIRRDSALRSQVLKEAEKTRNEIQLQPCQRIVDYEMRYPPAAAQTKPKP